MNAPFKAPALGLGDVIRLPDNVDGNIKRPRTKPGDREKKHLCVIVGIVGRWVYLAPILTDKPGKVKACPLAPHDMPDGLLDRSSYLAYDLITTRLLEELRRWVERERPKTSTCPPATWLRIEKALQAPTTTLPRDARLGLGLAPPTRRVLKDLTQKP